MTTCIDLRKYGNHYRVWNEIEGRRAQQRDDPWDLIVLGRCGFIAPYGGNQLLACTNGSLTASRILERVPSASVTQHGVDGQNVRFPAAAFALAAPILRLRHRRQVSEEQRQVAAQRLARYHFGIDRTPLSVNFQGPQTASGTVE
jgi:hypothetical protein